MRRGTQEDVVIQPALLENLRQVAAVAKAVDVEAGAGNLAEFLAQIALPVQPLAHERLAGGHVAVRLDPPAPCQLPAAFLHPRADLLEHGWVHLLDPFEKHSRTGGEDEVFKLIHAVEG